MDEDVNIQNGKIYVVYYAIIEFVPQGTYFNGKISWWFGAMMKAFPISMHLLEQNYFWLYWTMQWATLLYHKQRKKVNQSLNNFDVLQTDCNWHRIAGENMFFKVWHYQWLTLEWTHCSFVMHAHGRILAFSCTLPKIGGMAWVLEVGIIPIVPNVIPNKFQYNPLSWSTLNSTDK